MRFSKSACGLAQLQRHPTERHPLVPLRPRNNSLRARNTPSHRQEALEASQTRVLHASRLLPRDQVKRGKLQPWQPFWQWFELFETRTFNIWNTKMQRYATGYAINKLEVFGLIRQLCDELGNIVNSRLEWARLETNQACMEMGVLDREDELEKHMVMVTDVIVQDCKDRGSLLLFEVLTKKVLDGRKFSKHWVLDTWID